MHTIWHRLTPGQRKVAASYWYRVRKQVPGPCLYQQCLAGDVSGTKAPNCPAAMSATAKPIIPRLCRSAGLATHWSNQPDIPCWEFSSPK